MATLEIRDLTPGATSRNSRSDPGPARWGAEALLQPAGAASLFVGSAVRNSRSDPRATPRNSRSDPGTGGRATWGSTAVGGKGEAQGGGARRLHAAGMRLLAPCAPGASPPSVLTGFQRRATGDDRRGETLMSDKLPPVTRRTFLETTTAAAAAMMFPSGVHAQGTDAIRVGVVGTGGRGTGAIANILSAAEGIQITALGDLNPDRLEQSRIELDKEAGSNAAFGAKYKAG